MTKTSQWAGYLASFFAIAFFVTVTLFKRGDMPGWFAVVIGWCMMLGAFSGVVCLVSASFAFMRRGRQSDAPAQNAATPNSERRIDLDL